MLLSTYSFIFYLAKIRQEMTESILKDKVKITKFKYLK